MTETLSSTNISTKIERIAKLARQAPDMAFTTLSHHIDLDWLNEAYRRTRKDGATGVDGQSANEYANNLEQNLQSLLNRAKSGNYRAPPVRRVHIPKGIGRETRPLGIPTFEDKVLQRAVAMLLEAIYERDFLDCSHGFRPGRSARQALEVFRTQAVIMAGGWIVEIDIRKFFDSLDHGRFREVLRRRVRDGVILRLIGKWLKAGVLEDGQLSFPEAGTPQGGVVSPILANIYLHEVLDTWFEEQVRPRLRARAHLVRYADDALMLFEFEEDARRVLAVLPKRFEKYGLLLHPDKTRLVPFKRPDRAGKRPRGDGAVPKRPATFDFLGFTFHWGKSLAGKWVVRMRTASDRYRRALRSVAQWCRLHRHAPIAQQQRALGLKLRGHYGYYGRTGNFSRLWSFYFHVQRLWKRWLSRRSDKARLDWRKMERLLEHYPLPKPSVARQRPVANP